MKVLYSLLIACCLFPFAGFTQQKYSRQDSLFGSNTPQRSWWDVQHYDISVTPDYNTKTINGKNTITYTVLTDNHNEYLQFDLQKPLEVDSIYYNGKMYINYPAKPYYHEGNHYFIPLPNAEKGSTQSLTIVYHGKPKEAINAPWDGGWVWTKDKQGRPWISVACESDGASLWYPCKDSWSDEPDKGASLTVNVPEAMMAVGNGRLKNKETTNGMTSFRWEVGSPINAYNIIPYIGSYATWSDTLSGEKGMLDLNYWVLDYEVEKAKKQFEQVKQTMRAFEHWFGSYPFYEDGYQLVQAPYLGMEHQSAVAYGNEFKNGYLGSDLSKTGWGLKWDYIIVHESGHEWFGNNITAKDMADMWIHEAFTDYSETLFIDYYYGKQAGNEYTQGLRSNILNDQPIIGPYNVHKEGSGDMYFKGANLLHTIRQIIADDEKFRQFLRGLNKDFYHQTVTTKQVEDYISKQSGKDFSKVFDQYLRTAKIPVLEIKKSGNNYQYKWSNVINGFAMTVKLITGQWITPTTEWQTIKINTGDDFLVDKNFYISVKKL
ncbi:MAG: family metallopeptidase [Flavisolibacter sp.]|jgi:aminopeptidase N|nr:family metallopeptidase [Flavisolibacter sp.]